MKKKYKEIEAKRRSEYENKKRKLEETKIAHVETLKN